MNRLRYMKSKINRNNFNVGILKHDGKYFVAFGTNFNNSDCIGPFTYREAVFNAYRISFPRKKLKVTWTTEDKNGNTSTETFYVD